MAGRAIPATLPVLAHAGVGAVPKETGQLGFTSLPLDPSLILSILEL